MRYNVDIVINKNSSLFRNLNDKLHINYIDSYMMAGVLGYINRYSSEDDEKVDKPINIPRNVLLSRNSKLDYLWSTIYIIKNRSVLNEIELFNKAFETNDVDRDKSFTSLERFKLFHEYAIGGVEILHNELIEKSDAIGNNYVDTIIDFIDKCKDLRLVSLDDLD